MSQQKCSEIREKKPDQLENELNNLQQELHTLKIRTNKSDQIQHVRKSIARIHIVQNQMTKDNLRKFYQGEKHKPKDLKHKPKDLRPKQTRAMRRLLTPEEESIKLSKTRRKNCAFPKRIFTVKD